MNCGTEESIPLYVNNHRPSWRTNHEVILLPHLLEVVHVLAVVTPCRAGSRAAVPLCATESAAGGQGQGPAEGGVEAWCAGIEGA